MQHHLVSKQIYYRIFLALMVLTALTVGVAFLNLGPLNALVALVIAAGKATLVVLFFMHVRSSNRLIWLCVAAGIFWFLILLTFLLADYLSRGWLPVTGW
ncbi:MAG: oxidase [Candidatus Tectomicrobia bacterium]|uniref:Oxidase n=1 Tax=Tectimicrobiota bacterium TaxID=2528274 RepID=A0A937W665_UNCTE|nr:oxidase [Candidatus Tectomicrobia bacterium]